MRELFFLVIGGVVTLIGSRLNEAWKSQRSGRAAASVIAIEMNAHACIVLEWLGLSDKTEEIFREFSRCPACEGPSQMKEKIGAMWSRRILDLVPELGEPPSLKTSAWEAHRGDFMVGIDFYPRSTVSRYYEELPLPRLPSQTLSGFFVEFIPAFNLVTAIADGRPAPHIVEHIAGPAVGGREALA